MKQYVLILCACVCANVAVFEFAHEISFVYFVAVVVANVVVDRETRCDHDER